MNDTQPRALGHGISRIPLPLPFPKLRWVGVYLVEAADGLVLIDCGVGTPGAEDELRRRLAELHLDPADIRRLVGTHLHPDHVGLAGRVTADLGCEFILHERAAATLPRYNDFERFAAEIRELAARHGAPRAATEAIGQAGPRPDYMPPCPEPDRLVADGDRIDLGGGRHLEVLFTPGHEAAHICLLDSRTGALFSGDHILPRITPTVPHETTQPDALGDFLSSLERIARLDLGLTYPAHGDTIERGSVRASQIILHHRRRLAEMIETLAAGPATAWTVLEKVFAPHLTVLDQRLALRETLAHLEYLRLRGRLLTFEEDGVVWYRRP